MGKRQRDCARCAAPVGYRDRDLCCRCTRIDREAAAKASCPRCGKNRVLDPGTGRCATCSRACTRCGDPVRRRADTTCRACRRRDAATAARSDCPRCGRPGLLREATGWCGPCSRPRPAPLPPRTCPQCGTTTTRLLNGTCNACWQAHPDRPFTRAASLADELGSVPDWFDGFVVHVAASYSPARAASLVGALGKLLADGGSIHPQALIERSRQPGRSMGPLARSLQHHFTVNGLALPTDHDQRLAAGRRQRRIDAVPEPLRPAVAAYAHSLLASRQRAQQARTRPRSDSTIDSALAAVRDLAIHLHRHGRDDWALLAPSDIEQFLAARRPGNRSRTLTIMRQFCRWARARRLLLIDPTRTITIRQCRGFTGSTVNLARQRELFARWTHDPSAHPHESLIGLLALLHAASSQEIRSLTINDIDLDTATMQIGSRPHPTPIDPTTLAAIQRALRHREQLRTSNPHLLVTRITKGDSRPPSPAYVTHALDPVNVAPRHLRVTRLAELVNTMDPKLVATAFGMNPEGILDYLRDSVDPGRIPEELANPPAFGTT